MACEIIICLNCCCCCSCCFCWKNYNTIRLWCVKSLVWSGQRYWYYVTFHNVSRSCQVQEENKTIQLELQKIRVRFEFECRLTGAPRFIENKKNKFRFSGWWRYRCRWCCWCCCWWRRWCIIKYSFIHHLSIRLSAGQSRANLSVHLVRVNFWFSNRWKAKVVYFFLEIQLLSLLKSRFVFVALLCILSCAFMQRIIIQPNALCYGNHLSESQSTASLTHQRARCSSSATTSAGLSELALKFSRFQFLQLYLTYI